MVQSSSTPAENFEAHIVDETNSSITLSWESITYAEVYKVEQQQKLNEWNRVHWGSRTLAKICHLDENFCHKFRIVAMKMSEDKNKFVVLQISETVKAYLPTLPSSICLYRSIRKGEKYIVKKLLRRRPSLIDIPASNGLTPLANAIAFNENDIVDILLYASADIHKGNILKQQTPLHISFFNGDIPISRILINKKANINAQDIIGMTPAHYAIDCEKIEILKFALDNKCNTDIQDKCGWSLLQRAIVMNCNLNIIKLLIDYKCNLNAIDNNKLSCLDLANAIGNPNVIDLIKNTLAERS